MNNNDRRIKPWLLFGMISLLWSTGAWSQRGGTFTSGAKPWDSTSQGFPGYYDANMAAQGSVVVDFPSAIVIIPSPLVAIDYGVTDTLTVGTSAVLTKGPWLTGGAGATVKVRSLLVGNDSHQSAGTYYGGLFRMKLGGEWLATNYQIFTWNHAFRFGRRHTLYGHANYIKLGVAMAERRSLQRIVLEFSSFMLGGGYGLMLSPKWTLRANGVMAAYQAIDADTAGGAITITNGVGSRAATTAFYIGQAEYRPGPQWLLGFGVLGLSAGGTPINLPFFSWSRRW